ncbi:isochorismatase family protein [Kurthia massiliensis]|uniref:isochorismatase family protein n=1 Tax=Kurthia massiliensis TaxID=1033739 RepID=UPI00028A3AC8|nr:isochorismatase family protein [Kurthia massiliensis]
MSIPKIQPYHMPHVEEQNERIQWEVAANRSVLLIHDMQQYFLSYYDQTKAPIPELIANIQRIRALCHQLNIPIVYTAQPGDQPLAERALLTDFWGTGLVADDTITAITPALAPTQKDIVLAKWRYSAFKKSNLEELMKEVWGRDQLIICGIYAHIGCMLTAAEAFMLDIQPFYVTDAVADFSEEDHLMGIRYAREKCAQTLQTRALVAQLEALLNMQV